MIFIIILTSVISIFFIYSLRLLSVNLYTPTTLRKHMSTASILLLYSFVNVNIILYTVIAKILYYPNV